MLKRVREYEENQENAPPQRALNKYQKLRLRQCPALINVKHFEEICHTSSSEAVEQKPMAAFQVFSNLLKNPEADSLCPQSQGTKCA